MPEAGAACSGVLAAVGSGERGRVSRPLVGDGAFGDGRSIDVVVAEVRGAMAASAGGWR